MKEKQKIEKDKDKDKDALSRKIEKLYENYGINTSNMGEEEFERLKDLYRLHKRDINKDIKDSEKFKNKFEDDIL